jgi:predicted nucleotidyltransferase
MKRNKISSDTRFKNLKSASNEIYADLLGYSVNETSLKNFGKKDWDSFCLNYDLDENSSGIYLPRNQTAIIPKNNSLSLFHEYFGHGLYCEQNLTGKKLVDLEKKLLEEEKEFFDGKKFNLEELEEFRKGNETFNYLQNFKSKNLGIYEGFAVFSEYFLSKNFGLENLFESKYEKLNGNFGEYFNEIISFNEKFGDLATMYGFGMGKIQDKKRLIELSQGLFGKSLERARLVLHFGSGKPFSDIDLFVVSNDITSLYSEWVDVRAYNFDEIKEGIKLLDPKISDPIMIGKFIFGDREYQEELKNKILNQEITGNAINYNLEKWEHYYQRFEDNSLGEYLQNKNLRSAKTYLTNALALKNGEKILTFNELVDYSRKRFSHSEKFIELKGGIE